MDAIGRMTTAGVFSEFATPSYSSTNDITTGSDGALWFTEESGDFDSIGRLGP
jgi:streptogramin lyase